MTDPGVMPGDEVHAAGAVLWRPASGGPQVALVHRPRYDDWSFPKGKRMGREHVLVTAVREVLEETGERVVLGRRLPTIRYLSRGRPKRVDYWAAHPAGPQRTRPGGFVPGEEVDDMAWLPVTAARDRLSYPHDVTVLDSFAAAPSATTPLILLRHADALGKDAWRDAGNAEDLLRPLSGRGVTQAKVLSEVFDCFPSARLISSAAERCLATLRPYAGLTGAVIETEPAFTLQPGLPGQPGQRGGPEPEAAGWSPTPGACDRVGEITVAGRPAIICAHRQNLPWLLDSACQLLGAPTPAGGPLPTGAFWVLQVGDGGLASAERHVLTGAAATEQRGPGQVPGRGPVTRPSAP